MLFIPLRKADATARRVYARLDETVDRAGEAMDYAASAPVIKSWSDMQFAASGGKSRGNVRGQHGKVAAGLVQDISFDDSARAVEFGIDVVDDGEWEKVLKGVYTGISPGGTAARRRDGTVTRYAVTGLHEISLVDIPCIPTATFTLIKADGMEEQIAFAEAPGAGAAAEAVDLMKSLSATESVADFNAALVGLSAGRLEKFAPFFGGRVSGVPSYLLVTSERLGLAASGAALPDGRFPVTCREDVAAAVVALTKAADAEAQAHVVARAIALDLASALPSGWNAPLKKGLYTVSRFASLIDSLTGLASDVTAEAGWEADGSPIPARLCAWLAEGSSIFQAMAGEEAMEAVVSLSAAVAQLPSLPSLPAPIVDAGDDDPDEVMEKAAGLPAEAFGLMLSVASDLAAAREQLSKANAATASMRAELEKMRALPASGGIRLRAVGRGEDVTTSPSADDDLATFHAMPDGLAKAAAATRLAMTGRLPA